MAFPADLKYTKNHEYLKSLGDGTAVIGISDYAQEALGDVVYVQLPGVGTKLPAGEEFATVESVKTVSECYMPVAGEVVAVNGELAAHPEFVNEDAYGKGWMIKIKLRGDEVNGLLDAKEYKAHVASEAY